MDRNNGPLPDKDIGITVVFLMVLAAALLMMRYDTSSWLSNLLHGNTQHERLVAAPVPPL
jgi:hypothetical protein